MRAAGAGKALGRQRGSASSMRSDPPPTFRLPLPVIAIFEIAQPHSTLPGKPESGESFFSRAPADHALDVDASKPRVTVICVADITDSS